MGRHAYMDFLSYFRLESVAAFSVRVAKKYKAVLISSAVAAVMAYMFLFTNKLVNHDDIKALFDLGVGLSSGRWMIDLLAKVTITGSMPWLNGSVAVLLIAFASCAIASLFEIENPIVQVVLAAVIMVFPGNMDVFSYMFTSTAYSLGFLFSVLAVLLYQKGGKIGVLAGCLFGAMTLGIYQSYIEVTSTLLLLLVVKELLENEKTAGQIFLRGIKSVLFLTACAALYYLITALLMVISGGGFNDYAANYVADGSFLHRIAYTYTSFVRLFTEGLLGLVNNPYSKLAHIFCLFLILANSLYILVSLRDVKKALLFVLCLVLLPLSMNSMFFIFRANGIRAMMSFGFIGLYIFSALLIERTAVKIRWKELSRQLILWTTVLIIINNICVLNRTSLRMHLAYENAYSFFTTVLADIKMTPGYDEDCKIAIIGYTDVHIYPIHELGGGYVNGALKDVINVYSRNSFLQYYLGFTSEFADKAEQLEITQMEEFKEMPRYPYYGSIRRIGDYLVVKLDEIILDE